MLSDLRRRTTELCGIHTANCPPGFDTGQVVFVGAARPLRTLLIGPPKPL